MLSGSALAKSHHILTLRDLDDTRRPRRLSSRSRCSSSPTDSDPSAPVTLRSGGPVHFKSALFSSPPRSANFESTSPPPSRQISTSPVWGSPHRSTLDISAGLSPQQGSITHSPRGRQIFKITTPVSAEVPQDFLASSEAEDAAEATINGISLAPDSLEEETAHLMAQELPCTLFDADTDVAVASVLNAKLEFDETLLNESETFHCGAQTGRGEVEAGMQDVEMQDDNQGGHGSADEDSRHYFNFSRTVVCEAASGSDPSDLPQPPPAQSISQLDGADSGSESDESEVVIDDAQETGGGSGETKMHTTNKTPTKHLTVALKRLESMYTVKKSSLEQGTVSVCVPEPNEIIQVSNDDLAVQEEVFLDSTTGHFFSAVDGTVAYQNNNEAVDVDDDNISSAGSFDGFKDDLNDPDYSPEPKPQKSPIMQKRTIIVQKHPAANVKYSLSKPNLLQKAKFPKLILPHSSAQTVSNASASTSAASFHAVTRTVTSPIVINGLNSLPIQPGATRGRAIAIRLDNFKASVQQPLRIPTLAGASNSATSPSPAPQVLLVNRQGQILIKDPKSNTYQTLSTYSPTYTKISQIAKMLHGGNALQRPVPRLIIRTTNPPGVNITPASTKPATPEGTVIVRVVPVKSTRTSIDMNEDSEAGLSKNKESTAHAVTEKALESHQEITRTQPIILGNPRRPNAKTQAPPQFQVTLQQNKSPFVFSESTRGNLSESSPKMPTSSRSQVRVKRVSSVLERPCRKKSKMDLLSDPSCELDELNEARYETISQVCLFFAVLKGHKTYKIHKTNTDLRLRVIQWHLKLCQEPLVSTSNEVDTFKPNQLYCYF